MTNRDWATVFWLVIVATLVLRSADLRGQLRGIVRILFEWKILVPLGAVLGSIATSTYIAAQLDLWTPALTHDTVVWSIGPAMVLFFAVASTSREPHFFRKAMTRTIGLTVLVEFYVNLVVFSLPAELLLAPLVTILVLLSTVAGTQPRAQQVKRFLDGLIAAAGISLGIYVAVRLIADWDQIDQLTELRRLAMPIWMTTNILPVVYVISLLSNYELAFMRINRRAETPATRRRAKLALVSVAHLRTRAVACLGGRGLIDIADTDSFREARAVARRHVDSLRENHDG